MKERVEKPLVVVIAGPKGTGKSTAAPRILRERLGIVDFVNADVIARGLSGFDPDGAAIEAGRILLARIDALRASRRSFAFETTLSSRSLAPWLRATMASGYEFYLHYIAVPDAAVSIARVAQRVEQGGHHVPPETVARRFVRSAASFFDLYAPIAARWKIYDSMTTPPQRIATGGDGAKRACVIALATIV